MSTQRGQTIDLGGGAALAVLSPGLGDVTGPENMNDTSIVLRLTMGDLSFLLTGDITEAGETALIRTGADLDFERPQDCPPRFPHLHIALVRPSYNPSC